MCTVTFFPKGNQEYIFTHNRDEKKSRGNLATTPQKIARENIELIAPVDQKALGSWILCSETGTSACILNGAFKAHKKKEQYSRSRGKIIFELFDYPTVEEFLNQVDLQGVEPFTLLVCERLQNELRLTELRWDENKKHIQTLDASQVHIWSSATLYSDEVVKNRKTFFQQWKQENTVNPQQLFDFHQIGKSEEARVSIWRNDPLIFTVSTSQICINKEKGSFLYHDFLNQTKKPECIHFKIKKAEFI